MTEEGETDVGSPSSILNLLKHYYNPFTAWSAAS